MGQGASGSSQDKLPSSIVPTSTQLRRASLNSKFWSLQADGTAPTPVCLEGYGKDYAGLAEAHCGKFRREQQRCIRSNKLDPLDMSKWYPVCGEHYEMDSSCSVGLLKEVDRRCAAQLDRAAATLSYTSDPANSQFREQLKAIGQCMAQLRKAKDLKVDFDEGEAKRRFSASKNLIMR
eukprot:TRINITY_DN51133_c0_g1_i1.p1 TRINITY_DN51133_c0_g1~~TRINITY_DN51133_c0_g1_i1.p1  ORF type:complete len:178 (-),score=23.71 TRINITY_DN51133_c0_g1_i1:43-576(-)